VTAPSPAELLLVGQVLDVTTTAVMVGFVAYIVWLMWRRPVGVPGWPPLLLVWICLTIAVMDVVRAAIGAGLVHYVTGAAWVGCAAVTVVARRISGRRNREQMLRLAARPMPQQLQRPTR